VLQDLYLIDSEYYKIRNSVIDVMIPKSVFEKGSLPIFDRYLTIQSLRKKSLLLIMNIFENDLLKMEQDADEDNSQFVSLCRTVLGLLVELNTTCLTIEIFSSKCSRENLVALMKSIWSNIMSIRGFIENINTSLKEDNFSIKQPFDTLKSNLTMIKHELQANYNINLETIDYPISVYEREILNYIVNFILHIHANKHYDDVTKKKGKDLYNQTKKVLLKINDQFKINFADQDKVFECENIFFVKFLEVTRNGYDIEDKVSRYEALSEAGVKIYIVLLNYLDKNEKELILKGILTNYNLRNYKPK